MKDKPRSLRERLLLFIAERQIGDSDFVDIKPVLKESGASGIDIGNVLRGLGDGPQQDRLIQVQPIRVMREIGLKDGVSIDDIANAKLYAPGWEEVEKIRAGKTGVQLTEAQLRDFPRMRWQSSCGFWISVVIAAWTISSEFYRAVRSEKEQSSVSPTVQEQGTPSSTTLEPLSSDSVVTESVSLLDTAHGNDK